MHRRLADHGYLLRTLNTRTGGGSENHTVWKGGHIMPPIDLSSYES